MAEIDLLEIRETVFELCFDRYEGTFAGNQQANNKFDLERIAYVPLLRSRIAAGVAGLIEKYDPDLIVSTPRGADWLALDTARELGITALLLDKNERKEFYYREGGEETVRSSNRLAIIDDLFNRKTNTTKVYNLPGVADRAVTAAAALNRNPKYRAQLPLPAESLISEEVPDMMRADDPRWKYAR